MDYDGYEYDSYLEALNDYYSFTDEYIIINNKLYQYLEKQHLDNDYFFKLDKLSDDTFEFTTRFYNGGTSLDEILQKCKELK